MISRGRRLLSELEFERWVGARPRPGGSVRPYDGGMSTPTAADRPKPPAPECAPSQVGLCARCQNPCHRYGYGGNPLCVLCRRDVEAGRAAQ